MVMTNRASGVACITKLIDNITYTNVYSTNMKASQF